MTHPYRRTLDPDDWFPCDLEDDGWPEGVRVVEDFAAAGPHGFVAIAEIAPDVYYWVAHDPDSPGCYASGVADHGVIDVHGDGNRLCPGDEVVDWIVEVATEPQYANRRDNLWAVTA